MLSVREFLDCSLERIQSENFFFALKYVIIPAMVKEITITVEAKDAKKSGLHDNLIRKELKKNHINETQFEKVFVKKSIDARHGQLKLHLRYKVYIGE